MATHVFVPQHYHVTLGSHEPVLHIASGDTVETTTVDSRGQDHTGTVVTRPGNPQTGPFYLDGAEPGDVVALRIDKLHSNRSTGWTRGVLASNVVDPDFVAQLPADPELTLWDVDTKLGVARLHTPEPTLGKLEMPLDPMMGCFGTAPERGQAISTATSSSSGGNMDYRGFKPGVTVYFPVYAPGALIHVGDGHATQGDGEIVGTGIEISMDVAFTAWIHRKQQPILWPRADDGTYLLTAGNARPLDQALQHATTELLRWLVEDYRLTAREASLLLGQQVRYEVGNVFDPAFTLICKIDKRWMPCAK